MPRFVTAGLRLPSSWARFLEHSGMWRVKPLMIGRHILAWLWLMVWLTASPGVQARVATEASAPALAVTDGQGDGHGCDLTGVHVQALRASRRIYFQPNAADTLDAVLFSNAGVVRQQDVFSFPLRSDVPLGLTSGWQFLLRTALSPRAPSFVS